MTRPKVLRCGEPASALLQWRIARQRFRAARTANGWSQERAALELGVSVDSIKRWEHGKVAMPAWALIAIEEMAERKAA